MQTRSFAIYIRASADQIWQALTDARMTRQFYFGLAVESDWLPDSAITFNGAGPAGLSGRIVHIEPSRCLVHSLAAGADEPTGAQAWMTWDVEERDGGISRVTLTHDDLEPGADAEQDDICLRLVSNLKTLLETGAVAAPRPDVASSRPSEL